MGARNGAEADRENIERLLKQTAGFNSVHVHCDKNRIGTLEIIEEAANSPEMGKYFLHQDDDYSICKIPQLVEVAKLGIIVSATKINVSEFVWKHFFSSREAKCCFRNNFSRGGQTGKHRWKHVSTTRFPRLTKAKLNNITTFLYQTFYRCTIVYP